MVWVEKYRPKTLNKVVGQHNHINYLRKWSKEWENEIPNKRAIILYGQAGIGKTTIAHALAKENRWEILE